MNTLYFGDNLHVLRKYVKDESVDLIYLDPPFNSQASYNVLFKGPVGKQASAQITAFDDTWHWGPAAELAYDEVRERSPKLWEILRSLRSFLGTNDVMAYITMMAVRIVELHRVLKPTGSLYLHCDPTASHYLKIVLDGIFSLPNYRNEIIWLRSKNPKGSQHKNSKWGAATDTLLFYAKSSAAVLRADAAKTPTSEAELEKRYPNVDKHGRWADGPIMRSESMGARPNLVYEYKGFTPGRAGWRCNRDKLEAIDAAGNLYWTSEGRPRRKIRPDIQEMDPISNCWTDIAPINSQAQERLGYPTQKPVALLKRIISASSGPGDVVLDPFCGCGTTIHAAHELKRNWIGIDVTHLAIQIIEDRIHRHFPAAQFKVLGRPEDVASARDLADRDKYQFQFWAVSAVGGQPRDGERKGKDAGVDGVIYFKKSAKRDGMAVVSVKAGHHASPSMIRELHGTIAQEGADAGIFICLEKPTRDMQSAAASAGFVDLAGQKVQRIQIVTVDALFSGKRPVDLPPTYTTSTVIEAVKRASPKVPRKVNPEDLRRQPHMKLPLPGGKMKQKQAQLELRVDDQIGPLAAPQGSRKKRA